MHLTECPVVRECVATVVRQHLAEYPQDVGCVSVWPPCAHFLQGTWESAQLLLILRVNIAVWHTRCTVANGHRFADGGDLIRYMIRACSDPIFHMRTRKQRRPVEPARPPPDAVLYRSDGAARGQGQNGTVMSGAGAVFYGEDASVQGWKCASLGSVSNNIAEYVGAVMVLERIARTLPARSVLQMDSMLVTNQLCGRWHVAASDLVPYFRQANALLNRIRRRGVVIEIVHIYREFNKDADAKANMGADGTNAQHNW